MANRLAGSTSPYLRQHADNPVDWWEWSEEAFAAARERDVPVLLSVGYAACHWCHVMAHESFEDADVAALLNEHFVAIKVDREERPDIDAVYMDATTALTGHGGWPMTCVLDHDGSPFYAGTYYPRPQFLQLLAAVTEVWHTRREDVRDTGRRIADALAGARGSRPGSRLPGADDLGGAVGALLGQFDRAHGGFGGAPKFPPSMVLEFLLRRHEASGDPTALAMAEQTMVAMARGGMYDQLAGGFARYSVDAQWVVPHFEKMLYDNALLLRAYLHWWRITGAPLAERVVRETAGFLLRDLRTPEGGFASALDADADGVEGLTYAWTPQQLADVLGPADGVAAAALFGVTEEGTFEHGTSTLQLPRDPADADQYERWRAALLAARASRPQPARDDKVVTAWNGLAIAALAEAGTVLHEPEWVSAAVGAATLLRDVHVVDGRVRRASRDGVVGAAAGVAEDHGDLADGFLVLHQVTGDPAWLDAATALLDVALEHFADPDGGFFDTADDAERLVRRPQDPTDNAAPSGASALAWALLAASALTGSSPYREAAESTVAAYGEAAVRQPRFFGWTLSVAEALQDGPVQVAVATSGSPVGEAAPVGEALPREALEREALEREALGREALVREAWLRRPPGAVVAAGVPDAAGVPLLADRPLLQGRPTAYVCRGMVCDLPVTTVEDLRTRLADR